MSMCTCTFGKHLADKGHVLLWTWFAVIVLHFVTSTETNWHDVGEDEIENELYLDGMIITDRREFLNQYGRPRKQENTSHTEDEIDNHVDDMLGKEISFYSRLEREERDTGSGDDNMPETPQKQVEMIIGLSVGIPVFFIAVGIIVFLCIWRRRRRQKYEDDSDDGHRNTPLKFDHISNDSRITCKKVSNTDASSWTLPTRKAYWNPLMGASNTDFTITSFENDHAVYQGQSEFDQSSSGDSVREFGKGHAAMSSHFSWGALFDKLNIGTDFSLKRPVISISPYGANQNNQANDFRA